MAEIEKTEFEFPHEVEEKQSKAGGKIVESDEPEIEVIDDTPEEDRGREPMKTPPEEPTDEELASYSKRDRTKTREFHKAYHDERRAKEAALREKEEAIRIAQQVYEENQRLKGTVDSNQNIMLDQVKRTISQEIDQAKAKYKKAYEDGDSEALVDALFYSTVYIGGLRYYFVDDTYYSYDPGRRGYVVVQPPSGSRLATAPAPAVEPPSALEIRWMACRLATYRP
jgi:hypothetical protein